MSNCDTLERAQDAKLDRAAALLDLNGGERVLEIGCGWGAFAERLIRRYGASVFGITLSAEQLGFARTRLAGEIERRPRRIAPAWTIATSPGCSTASHRSR